MIAPGTMQRALEPPSNPAWVVDADGYNELREATLELRFALSSGSLGVKGTFTLDLKRGALIAECCLLKAPDVGIRLRSLRAVSLSERGWAAADPIGDRDGEVELAFEASFEGANLAQGEIAA